jgi:hypothetical protein
VSSGVGAFPVLRQSVKGGSGMTREHVVDLFAGAGLGFTVIGLVYLILKGARWLCLIGC